MLVAWRRKTGAVATVTTLAAALLGAGQAAAAPRVHAHTQVTAGRVVTRPGVPPAVSQDPRIAAEIGHDNTVGYDGNSFNIDGQRIFLWSGEFHYFRLPSPSLWRDVLQKMKSGGFDAVSIYFDWAYHSPRPGVYGFAGVRNLDELLDIAEQVGLYVVAPPGSLHQWRSRWRRRLPGWSTTLPGNSRSADAAYLSAALAWQHQIDRILARHQVTNGTGTVLLDQIENEYCFASSTQNLNPSYMEALENQARADGITVPLFTNVCYPAGATWASGPGKVDVDDGAFERIIAEDAIAGGFSGMNFYMEYGGTTWGWQTRAIATLTVPAGWTATALGSVNIGPLAPGASTSTRWTVTAPATASPGSLSLVETITYASGGQAEFTTAAAAARVPYGSLAAAFDNTGVTADSAPSAGDFDGAGSTFSATALANIGVTPGATVTADGRAFTWPGSNPGTPDNVLADGQAIALAGQGGSLAFLGASADGDTSGTADVYYTDGTAQQVTLSFSDFYFLPPRVASNQVAFTTSYFDSSSGGCYEGTARAITVLAVAHRRDAYRPR